MGIKKSQQPQLRKPEQGSRTFPYCSGYRELGRRNNSKGNKTKMKKQKNTVVQKNTCSTKNHSKNTEVITNPRNILLPISF
jgi:hypothetical protein